MAYRWLVHLAGLVVLAVAGCSLVLLAWSPSPRAIQLPPGPVQPAQPTPAPDEAAEVRVTPSPVQPRPTHLEALLEGRAAVETGSAPAARGVGPIVEPGRIQERPSVPAAESRPVATPPDRHSEFDRDAAARARGVAQHGGTPQTESAVEAGLAWLAVHQAPEGIWDRFRFAELDPPSDRCTGQAVLRTEASLDAGLTGLCLLAFLGAGYTDSAGPYPEVVRRGVDALLKMQQEHGGFGPGPVDGMAGYNDALATFALAEYAAMTRDERVAEPLRRAVERLAQSQQALGGWDYQPWPNVGRNDTSITGWVVQALQACAAAGVEVPAEVRVRAALHFARATEPDGQVRYADAGIGFALDARGLPKYRYGAAMTAAGLVCEQLLGWRLDGAIPHRQAALLFADAPSSGKARGRDRTQLHSEYYWYYGTVAMFQRGGAEWERWNAALRDAILPLQNREKTATGKKRAAHGSWDPYGEHWGRWGKMGSRIYTTAIGVLTLEIYYRHTPAYLTEEVLLTGAAWREYLARAAPRERRDAVGCLAQLRHEIGEAVLVDLLRDSDPGVALAAAEALAWNDSPMGLNLLEEVVTRLPPWGRQTTQRALERARAIVKLPPTEGRVRAFDAERKLAALELPRAYVGMPVSIRRGGREIARLRVVQRFSGGASAIAEVADGALPTSMPQPGDAAAGG